MRRFDNDTQLLAIRVQSCPKYITPYPFTILHEHILTKRTQSSDFIKNPYTVIRNNHISDTRLRFGKRLYVIMRFAIFILIDCLRL